MFFKLRKTKKNEIRSRGKNLPLILARIGQRLKVASIEGGNQIRSRLADLGIFPNSEVQILNRSESGPVTILVKGSRIAIGRGLSSSIMVENRL